MVTTVLLVAAIICFVLDTLGIGARIRLTPLGLAFLTATFLI